MTETTWEEEEINYSNITCEEGVYPFNVAAPGEIKVSKKGKPYINLRLELTLDDDSKATLFTMLMPAYPRALKQFCSVTGVARPTSTRKEDLERFCEDIIDSEGFVRVVNKARKGGDPDELQTEVVKFLTDSDE